MKVGGYAHNDAQICVTQIERVLEKQTFEDSVDGTKGLASKTNNLLTKMKSTVSIRRADIPRESKAAAILASTSEAPVEPKIATTNNAQDKADR